MTEIAIRVENLSKLYRIGAAQERHDTLRDALAARLRRNEREAEPNTIWALKDVSFEVKRGEVVGVIGRNGAGKSTLLKLLSRITEPTSGRAEIHGRVGSLLEVGTGFHPELTGRENIYLNGVILGMKRVEISARFDEIVAFAELEKFLDTPVKRYSSGMYVRLAFAVAAHLEPEILLVDEVLAVGDAEFQRKCLGKMGDVAKEGRTVLFVSHNMAAIQRLCEKSLLLRCGELVASGPSHQVTGSFLGLGSGLATCWERSSAPNSSVSIRRIELADHFGRPMAEVTTASDLAVAVDFRIERPYRDLQMTVGLLDSYSQSIFDSSPQDDGIAVPTLPGDYRAMVRIPAGILMPTRYAIKVGFWQVQGGVLDYSGDLQFSVVETSSMINSRPGGRPGLLALRCNWDISISER
jgi:lipopolysaccharide transport system ATP-binding protein